MPTTLKFLSRESLTKCEPAKELDPKLAKETLNVLLKYQQDIEVVEKEINGLISTAAS